MRKRIIVLFLCTLGILTLTACDNIKTAIDQNQVKSLIYERVALNVGMLDDLKGAGLLTDEVYEKYNSSIKSQLSMLEDAISALEKGDTGKITKLRCFEVGYHSMGYSGSKLVIGCDDGYNSETIHNYIKATGDSTEPLDLLLGGSSSGAASAQEQMNYEVWVLKPGEAQTLNSAGLQAITDAVNKAQSGSYEGVKKYFEPSGYTLFGNKDPYGPGGLFVKTSKVEWTSGDTTGVNTLGKNLVIPTSADFRSDHSVTENKINNSDGTTTSFFDLSHRCLWTKYRKGESFSKGPVGPSVKNADFYWAAQIKLIEFNKETVRQLVGAGSSSEKKYVLVNEAGAGEKPYALLMEYPVDIISNLKYSVEDGSWEVDMSDASNMRSSYSYNILTGAVRFRTSNINYISHAINWGPANEVLINSGSFLVETDLDKVAVTDTDYMEEQFVKAENRTGIGAVHMLLTDYLELSYLPGIVEDENLVALGRRLRVTHTSGNSLDDQFAIYLDKAGNPLMPTGNTVGAGTAQYIPILAGDVMDSQAAAQGKIKTLGDPDSISNENNAVTGATGVQAEHEKADQIYLAAQFWKGGSTINRVTVNRLDNVVVTDTADGDSEATPPPMYGIGVSLDPFNTGLYSAWIATSDESKGSLGWWLGYLQSAGYKYTIDNSALEQVLMGTYSSELRANGIIILDLSTIGKIQEEYREQDRIHDVTMLRTVFAMLGIVLGVYGLLLMAAWAVDINLVGGPKLLTLITFGRWIAVTNSEEFPGLSDGDVHYLTFGGVLKAAVMMIAVGTLLSVLDVISIVNVIIQMFGKFAEFISTKLIG